ncbi:uncharacterized protein ARB_00115 [Trichophyton benhamiae CBS 112371]|uniref:HpcH/HpaI aldolase/citrate lyase domain-containing protein n=1 Tax=Arthroderma benhamiae (strain ATCC MYA-4681 / CBS 112371) TaxID=663331 RepID=D4AVA6_ARTBC|nr:uncharacterized protein ARB_00115 [Trichophyton benhamiae CBS 112371]EFE33028.1 hypothetical protein ARB_00115 [Trichophyton benhamiae CBS 112371]
MVPAADIMAVDETKRLVGNRAGLGILQTLESMQQRLTSIEQELKQLREETRQFREEAKQYREEAKQYREGARQFREEARQFHKEARQDHGVTYEHHIRTWMLLRGPIYKSRDLDILRFLANNDAFQFAIWAGVFELIYGIPYGHGKLISRRSKVVRLVNARADLTLLDSKNTEDLRKCNAIIKFWKTAIDSEYDPEGIFRIPAVADMSVLRRALLYVPGSSQRMLDKSRMLSVDCIAYDLEDSVTPSKKAEARRLVRAALDLPSPAGVRERAVRINSVGSGLALADLTEVLTASQLKSPNLSTLVVPKVDSASDLTFISDVISHTSSSTKQISILALVESAKAITNLSQICTATPLLSGLIFAAEDFALDLSITRTPSLSEFLYARSAIVTAARAHELPSAIDLVCTSYKQDGGIDGMSVLEEESRSGKRLGFNGKQCIHPTQVERVQGIFGPEEKEVEWAVRVVIADEKAARQGRGAWTLDGKMIDVPVAEKARAIVRKAEACGIDVESVKGRWKHQEPE